MEIEEKINREMCKIIKLLCEDFPTGYINNQYIVNSTFNFKVNLTEIPMGFSFPTEPTVENIVKVDYSLHESHSHRAIH
jgi:hypothetical protein